MLLINDRVIARGTHSSLLTEAKVGGRSRGGGGSGVTWGARYLFWYPFISGKGGGGGTDGVRVVRGWLLTLLTMRLGMRLVFCREMVVSTNITTHRSDGIFSRE